ncbi:lysozyme g-like [Pristis pectinata]|uniref:lysozyme g-like n=1 Tax=Pristis pectinata TaxID=685728 RepID=UPI00223E1247|nr:lysozyme g-like [Pristis pectinata]
MSGASIYGDITRVETTGASQETANQDNLNFKGVAASHRLMATDLQRVNRYKSLTQQVAHAHQIDPAIIGAIISRESRGGNALVDGYGDYGNAFGLMQVDVRYHSPVGGWDSKEHLMQATGILVKMIEAIQQKFPYWTKEQQLKGGISAYNMGPGNVESYNNVDARTTGKDYSNDVVARAQWLKKNGF